MAKKAPRGKVYVTQGTKVESRRPGRALATGTDGQTDPEEVSADYHPLELLLAEIEAVHEEVGGIAEYLKAGRNGNSRYK